MKYTLQDAIYMALDAYKAGEITLDQLDATATELWAEMQAENAEDDRTGNEGPA